MGVRAPAGRGGGGGGLWDYLDSVVIFARMSPDDKERVLKRLKQQGRHTFMCGDGANDVGALKQAHVGVALLSGFDAKKTCALAGMVAEGGGGGGVESNGAGGGQGASERRRRSTSVARSATRSIDDASTASSALPPEDTDSRLAALNREKANSVA